MKDIRIREDHPLKMEDDHPLKRVEDHHMRTIDVHPLTPILKDLDISLVTDSSEWTRCVTSPLRISIIVPMTRSKESVQRDIRSNRETKEIAHMANKIE